MWSIKVVSGHNQYVNLAIVYCLLFILSAQFSLTSLFYGEPSEKEKSPSESSPSDSETKDMVSFVHFVCFHQLVKAPRNPVIAFSDQLWHPVDSVLNKTCFDYTHPFSTKHISCVLKVEWKRWMYFLSDNIFVKSILFVKTCIFFTLWVCVWVCPFLMCYFKTAVIDILLLAMHHNNNK